ncbi:ATP-dependent nuclease [Pseudodesulfovibrio pelocollis]|uniref:ATP-dependent nuclease n=1 Tax=Pseudodesulfovibrio pelocollis TaxID=3051432 RepID=UPI00255B3EE4|nr:AAA family ATPase [Pseudodesulfovibrio sp. SB368]
MKVINKIEINYFRSAYSITLTDLSDITTLIGENDSGKSNILKALNLFFNNETELGTAFNFTNDISRTREKEAKKQKGRMTVWVKITFNNFKEWRSLPDSFYVKKVWTRYSQTPDMKHTDEISRTTIGKFLNSIRFHYIPPVRSREIFSCYLNLLHDALIDDEKAGISDSSGALMGKINESTESMAEKIQTALGIESTIDVPKDLRILFSALDFTTKHNDFFIPLQKRGDGLQTRHIPYILDFVARRSKVHHIWAYEEPENSLEISKAYDLALQLKDEFSQENQIFITTHSPAFYDISGEKAKRFHVYQHDRGGMTDKSSHVAPISSRNEADSFVGTAAFIAARTKSLVNEHAELKESNAKLAQQLRDSTLTQVVVEGPTDKIILDKALAALFPRDHFCEFVPANCATKLLSYLQACDHITKSNNIPTIGIFDNDNEGRQAYDKLKYAKTVSGGDIKVINKVKKVYAMLIPMPDEAKEIQNKVNKKIDGSFSVSIPIEFLFPRDVIARAIKEKALVLRQIVKDIRDRESKLSINFTEKISPHIHPDYKFLAYDIDSASKITFADWLCKQPPKAFQSVYPLLKKIKALSQSETVE